MKTALFDFHLPDSLIAERPALPRESARLLCVHGHALTDASVGSLPQFLRPHDLLIFNDTRVIPARLRGMRGQVAVELLLHKPLPGHPDTWECFARPAKRLKTGDRIEFADSFQAAVAEKRESGEVVLDFSGNRAPLAEWLSLHGSIPLPPYIEKKRPPDARDRSDYQTVYAGAGHSVAAPTAGLHFTPELFRRLDEAGIRRAFVTLHVGAGTFLPVKAEDTDDHRMHAEYAEINEETVHAVQRARAKGGRVIAVGTTSLRTLESAAGPDGALHPFAGETAIFITPGYRFRCADMLLTNFHLPKSTLYMLVSAFAGMDVMRAAYVHAIARQYRFYSYGDACLLFRERP